jgi:hypothetical protein
MSPRSHVAAQYGFAVAAIGHPDHGGTGRRRHRPVGAARPAGHTPIALRYA